MVLAVLFHFEIGIAAVSNPQTCTFSSFSPFFRAGLKQDSWQPHI
jgi:hypothetical protein